MNEGHPNFDEAQRFLAALAPDDEITFVTIPESSWVKAQPNPRAVSRTLHGAFDEHAATLSALNISGAGVFFMVNRGDDIVRPGAKTCRTAANVRAVRACFIDLDGSPIEPVLEHAPKPHIVVESSPGKWHAYWRVDGLLLEQFSGVQKRLAKHFNGDPAVSDLPRIMRVPGFWHLKSEPFQTRIQSIPE